MLRVLAFALVTTILAGTAIEAVPSEAAGPRPQYGSFGFDVAGMDRSVAPGDNFYQFANGTWGRNTPIPSDKPNYGAFSFLDDLSHTRTHEILEQAKADPN